MGMGWGNEATERLVHGLRARSELAHLAPRVVHSIAQALDLLQLRHVRRERDEVLLADDLRDLLRGPAQALLVHVCDRDLEPDPARSWGTGQTAAARADPRLTLRARWRPRARCRWRHR